MAPMPTARHGLGSAAVDGRLYVISGGPKPGGSYSNVNEMFVPPDTQGKKTGSRASSKQVGAVMAFLATFQDAQVLPPESSPEATRLIRALIQFQAAFMKSNHPAVRQLLTDALTARLGDRAPAAIERFQKEGWTSQILEAVVEFADGDAAWVSTNTGLEEGFRGYNVGRNDFDLLAHIFRTARTQLAANGQDLHTVYASRRRDMPGAGL
jgi:hypothetical protein